MKLRHTAIAIISALSLMAGTNSAYADEPFRLHRYSGFQTLPVCDEGDIVFIGNSITHMMNWYEGLGSHQNIHGRGNSGGMAHEILNNLESMIAGNPSKVFLMIGINDLHAGTSPSVLVSHTQQIIERIRAEVPTATVYYQSVLPTTYTTKANLESTNSTMKSWIASKQDDHIVFVDIYSRLATSSGTMTNAIASPTTDSYSWDGLHLTQKAYRIWMDEIKKYLPDGYECVFPATADNLWGGQTSSWGMRVTYFGAEPVTSKDILMIGDETIHGGEWHELLGSADFKDRGNNWAASGFNVTALSEAYIDAILTGNKAKGVTKEDPKAVILYAGYQDIHNGGQAATVFNNYKTVVNLLRSKLPTTPIFVTTLPPGPSTINSKITEFNNSINREYRMVADTYIIDINSALSENGSRNENCFMAQSGTSSVYLSGIGYAKFAHKLAEVVNAKLDTEYTAVTDEEAAQNLKLYNLLTSMYRDGDLNAGNDGTPLTGDQLDKFRELLPEVRALLKPGNIDAFYEALSEAYKEARNEAGSEVPDDEDAIYIRPSTGKSYSVVNATGAINQQATINCGRWIANDSEAGLVMYAKDSDGTYRNIFNADSDWLNLQNGNSSIDIIYHIACDERYVINGVSATLVPVDGSIVPWKIEGMEYNPSAAGTKIEFTGLETNDFVMDCKEASNITIKGTYFKDFKVYINKVDEETDGIEGIYVDSNDEPEYFNLQGMRVSEPVSGSFYIVRQGSEVRKVLIK